MLLLVVVLLLFEITNVDSSDVGLSYSIALHSNGEDGKKRGGGGVRRRAGREET